MYNSIPKSRFCQYYTSFMCFIQFPMLFLIAGEVGIEPTHTVLETVVLPLYDSPFNKTSLVKGYFILFCFFVQGVFFTEFAKFIQFQPFFQNFLIFSGKIIGMLAFFFRTLHFYQIILRHIFY